MTDQLGREIKLNKRPCRIVSLVPSQTELLFSLGLEDEVVGITKFCIHPESWQHSKKRIGGTKSIDIEAVKSLQPDLIIGNKEENLKEEIEMLSHLFPVWMSDVNSLADALEMIRKVSELTEKHIEGEQLAIEIESGFSKLQREVSPLPRSSVAYLIWKKPFMVSGNLTFIDDMLHQCGFINCFKNRDRYPEISLEELGERRPEIILLPSEPYPFTAKEKVFFENRFPHLRVCQVDGEFFSWYGSRLVKAADYFLRLRKELIG